MADTVITFWGGTNVIGGTKVTLSTPTAELLFDCGPGGDEETPPQIPGFFTSADDGKKRAVVLSHAHIDHDGFLTELNPGLEVIASPQTAQLEGVLAETGFTEPSRPVKWRAVEPEMAVQFGDISLELVPVNHDVPGACGVLFRTNEGKIAYTGDINFHTGEASNHFVERAQGVDLFISETTGLSFDDSLEPAPLDDVLAQFKQIVRQNESVYFSVYERDAYKCEAFLNAIHETGKQAVLPPRWGQLFEAYVQAGLMTSTVTSSFVTVDEFDSSQQSSDFVYLLVPESVELAQGAGNGVWFHCNGEPLGPFMDNYSDFHDVLDRERITVVEAGISGHATGAALQKMVDKVAPHVLAPVHGFHPERLRGPFKTLLPDIGQPYDIAGEAIVETGDRKENF